MKLKLEGRYGLRDFWFAVARIRKLPGIFALDQCRVLRTADADAAIMASEQDTPAIQPPQLSILIPFSRLETCLMQP